MDSLYSHFIVYILITGSTCTVRNVDYTCLLKWESEGYGNIPPFALSPGPGEYVARVNIDLGVAHWRIGRIIPEEGKADVVLVQANGQHTTFSSETYDVLTNPDKCLVEWLDTVGSNVPRYVVPADDNTNNEWVGRAVVAGFAMTGTIQPEWSSLLVAYDGRVYSRRHYQAMTSRYPLLNVLLSNFKFPILDFRVLEERSKEMLIGQMELVGEDTPSEASSSLSFVQPIAHSKQVKEVFRWDERQKWEGVANLTIDMDLWVGSPSVLMEVINLHNQPSGSGKVPKVFHKRDRNIQLDRTVTLSVGSLKDGTDLSKGGRYQVCSAATFLEDFGVRWEATAIVTAQDMRGDQIIEILRRTGRNILGEVGIDPTASYDEDEDVVVARFFGVLRGSFVTGTTSHIAPVDSHGACNSVVMQSKHQPPIPRFTYRH